MSDKAFKTLPLHEQVNLATTCKVPQDLPVDLRVKLAIAFIHLKKFDIVKPMVAYVMK